MSCRWWPPIYSLACAGHFRIAAIILCSPGLRRSWPSTQCPRMSNPQHRALTFFPPNLIAPGSYVQTNVKRVRCTCTVFNNGKNNLLSNFSLDGQSEIVRDVDKLFYVPCCRAVVVSLPILSDSHHSFTRIHTKSPPALLRLAWRWKTKYLE